MKLINRVRLQQWAHAATSDADGEMARRMAVSNMLVASIALTNRVAELEAMLLPTPVPMTETELDALVNGPTPVDEPSVTIASFFAPGEIDQ